MNDLMHTDFIHYYANPFFMYVSICTTLRLTKYRQMVIALSQLFLEQMLLNIA